MISARALLLAIRTELFDIVELNHLIPFLPLRRPHVSQQWKPVDVDALLQQRSAHFLVALVSNL
jgi:hypothetical protein